MENLSKEELINRIIELEEENRKLKRKKEKKKRPRIKTTKKQIVDYWSSIEDECGLSVDWAEAEERCWRCGYKKKLQRCHIIPDSLGGKDEPSNLVLLCERCHIDAPNIESKTFMWDWIRANGTSFYDTFWQKRAEKEYEFIYKKKFIEELKERDILSPRDLEKFFSIPPRKSVNHFAHPWKNDSTNAGLLRMRLEEYDKKYKQKEPKTEHFRKKEEKFNHLVWKLCKIAKEYHFDVWEGRTKNPFSITLSCYLDSKHRLGISIKLGRQNKYKGCFTTEVNPNNMMAKEYDIELGTDEKAVEEFVKKEITNFCGKYGKKERQEFVFTIDPLYHLREDLDV